MKISIVCHGNIGRSQILHHYIEKFACEAELNLSVYSCGTASEHAFPNAAELLKEVQAGLFSRGLDVAVQRNWWNEHAVEQLKGSDIILVADEKRRQELLDRLGDQVPRATPWRATGSPPVVYRPEGSGRSTQSDMVYLFYEFIGEGTRDFVDTYDPVSKSQDSARFKKCFDELERIARLAVDRIKAP